MPPRQPCRSGSAVKPGQLMMVNSGVKPFAELLPIDFRAQSGVIDQELAEGFPIAPTPLGMASPHMQLGDTRAETEVIWKNLPEIFWMTVTEELKPGARVLAAREADRRRGNLF